MRLLGRLAAVALMAQSLGCTVAESDGSNAATPPQTTTGDAGAAEAGFDAELPAEPELYASFVAGTTPGEAPALLRLANDSVDEQLSLTLDDGQAFAFFKVEPATVTDYVATAVSDALAQVIVSRHTIEGCIRINLQEIGGPNALEPQHAYTIHVSLTDEEGFVAAIVEDELPAPFFGIRPLVLDPAASPMPAPSKLTLTLQGEGLLEPELVFEAIFDELPGPFVALPGQTAAVAAVTFVDRAGGVWEHAGGVELGDAPGHTIVISREIAADMHASFELAARSP